MNKRIKELAEQAGLGLRWETTSQFEAFLEKFAELIIREVDEALRQALEGFENIRHHFDTDEYAYEVAVKSITAIKQALEETQGVSPEPESVAWGVDWGNAGDSPCVSIIKRLPGGCIEVVAVEYGPKREWQGLTGDERDTIVRMAGDSLDAICLTESKLKEKNT